MKSILTGAARALAIVLVLVSCPAVASEKPDAAREQVKRLQIALRKAEQEKAQAAADKAAVESRLKDLEGKASDSRKQASSASTRVAALKEELATAKTEKDALAAKLAETEQQLAKISEQHRATEAERVRLDGVRVRLEASVAEHKQVIGVCEDRNAKLHAVGLDLLEKYRTKGCFDSTLQNEPFTGLRQVEIENAIEDGRDKLDELRVEATNRK